MQKNKRHTTDRKIKSTEIMKSEKAHNVPEGYFAQLEQDLLKIPQGHPAPSGILRNLWTPMTRVAAAAAIAFSLGLGIWNIGTQDSSLPSYDLAKLSQEDISDYLYDEAAYLPSTLLAEEFEERSAYSGIDDEDLELYLEETTEYDLLMEWDEM